MADKRKAGKSVGFTQALGRFFEEDLVRFVENTGNTLGKPALGQGSGEVEFSGLGRA